MVSRHYTTLSVPPRQQFAAWCAWFEPVFDVAPPAGGPEAGFEAEVTVTALGRVAFSRVQAPELRAIRHARNIARDPVDHWNVVIGRRETQLTLRGEVVTIPAGVPFVVSLGDPLQSAREADERLQVFLPRDHCPALAPALDRLRGVPLVTGAGALLRDYLALVARNLPTLAGEDLPRLGEATVAMVRACVAPSEAASAAAARQVEVTELERVRQAIRRRLASATLSTGLLCRETGISRSRLYRLLEGEGGVARYIQRLRLRGAHAALSDAEDARQVAAIGEACGFFDASTFSRAFRREFGVTPTDLRAAARAGMPPPQPAGGPVMPAEASTLKSCLRAI